MTARFAGLTAIVTGGANGIGKATAELFAREGAKVLIADISDVVEITSREFSGQGMDVIGRVVDVTSETAVAAMVSAALERWQRLDIMVANAGIGGVGSAEDVDMAVWERVLAVNLNGVFLCTRHAVPAMRANGGGAIVNVASVMGLVAPRGAVSYAASKAAVINMTRATAIDHAADGIRINVVCPGHLESAIRIGGTEARMRDNRELVARYPIGRLGRARDVACAIAFLASDDAAFITGTTLVVDGGFSAQ